MHINTGASSGGEETSRDMLKNTPSNIRRLAGEIEQHAGRQKYLAQTRSPSDGGDVRWYFCKVPLAVNVLAASVPHTEVVGKGDYFRFGMRDSLAVEASFLQREEELVSSWWKEYAECSEGPSGQPSINSSSSLQKGVLSADSPEHIQRYETEEDRVGVPVKGGLYEVDLTKRHCFSVYWSGENRRVLRGHWFARKGGLDWLPVREDVSEQLEYAYRSQVWHRRTFQESGLFAARVDLQGSIPGLQALFTGEDDTWEAWLKCGASGISRALGLGGNTYKLRRGFAPSESRKPTQDELHQQKEEEMDDYCSQVPVRHLVFMVHGIGQRLENSNLVDDVGDFRHITARLAERHLTSHQLGTQRILFIPCQWRKGLALSGETAVENITLDGVRGLRTMLGATVHDVLYYMSPIYCQHIIDSVSYQLNKLYLKFLKRNPGYNGKVSLYGHSLGSVLSFDILCHQEALNLPCPTEMMHNDDKRTEASCSGNDNVSFGRNPVSNSGDENSKNVEVLSMVGPVDNSDLIEDHVDVYPVTSESDGSTTTDIGYQLTNDESSSSTDEDKPSGNSNEIESYKSDSRNYSNSMTSDILACEENRNDKGICDTSEDQTINLLREEIDLLKEKIKKFKAQFAEKEASVKQVHSRKASTAVTPPDPENVQHGKKDTSKGYTPLIRYTKLEFNVDTFFAVGSPLGVFLSLRNACIGIGKGKPYWEDENIIEEMPACRQMFNIFHPFDPVAYRIEPLICKEFIDKRPIIIPYHRGGKRLYVAFQDFREGLASRSEAFVDQLSTARVKVLTACESRCDDIQDEASEKPQEKQERTYGSVMMERLTGSPEGRIDHVLQDKTFRHPYVSAIGSHTNYWRDPDTSLFMLNHLYRDIPEEPPSPTAQPEGSSEDDFSSEGWTDPRDAEEEELPLTFADRVARKKFAYRAKKMMRS